MKLTVLKGFQAIGFSNEARENQKIIITWTHGFKLFGNWSNDLENKIRLSGREKDWRYFCITDYWTALAV